MKILRIISSGYQEGGAETGVAHLQPVLEARGHEVRTLASDAHPEKPHFNQYSFKAPRGLFGRLAYTWNPSAYRSVKRALGDFDPDVVHLHTLGSASPAVLFALSGYPTVATVHGPEVYTRDLLVWLLPKSDFKDGSYDLRHVTIAGRLRYAYYRYVNYPLYRLGLRAVDRFITISRYVKEVMARQGIESTLILNGIKPLPQAPLDASSMPHTLICAGRLESFKGYAYAIQAMPGIRDRYPDARLVIIGEGPEQGNLETLAERLGVSDAVEFAGRLPHEEVAKCYAEASVALVPSLWPEVCSRSGIEALSAGRPVVGSDAGGNREWLIDGETGYLVPPRDAKAIEDAVLKLFSDPRGHARMAAAAREKAQAYDIGTHAAQVEALYSEVAARFSARKRRPR